MNHYKWLEKNLESLFISVGLGNQYSSGIITAHGDKCYSYEKRWSDAGIPFNHGVAMFLLSYFKPYCLDVRDTPDGWVDTYQWVIEMYPQFKWRFNELENKNEK